MKTITGSSELLSMKFGAGGTLELVPSRYRDEAARAAPGHADFDRVIGT